MEGDNNNEPMTPESDPDSLYFKLLEDNGTINPLKANKKMSL